MQSISVFNGVFAFFLFQIVSGVVLDKFLNEGTSCESQCDELFSSLSDLKKACGEGCRLFKIIGLAKGSTNNKTLGLCLSACSEAFTTESSIGACNNGCHQVANSKSKIEDQTIHLLTPLFYMRSAYNSMAHHVRQFISTSWTVYVQEDSGKMVVLQTNPRIIENREYPVEKEKSNYLRTSYNYQPWQKEKLDWMDCISHQSGIPRWILVIVLFGFILALLWLCCATAVTAPYQYISSQAKKKNVGYVLLCEPNKKAPIPPPLISCNEEAPPLPPKVSLI